MSESYDAAIELAVEKIKAGEVMPSVSTLDLSTGKQFTVSFFVHFPIEEKVVEAEFPTARAG